VDIGRGAAPTLLATALVAALVGCGADARSPVLPPNGPVTKAQIQAYASAVNLGAADVPGGIERYVEAESRVHGLVRLVCGGKPGFRDVVAEIHSPLIERRGLNPERADSTVAVWRSARIAAENWRGASAPAIRPCIAHRYERAVARTRPGPRPRVVFLPPVAPATGETIRVIEFGPEVRHGHRIRWIPEYTDNLAFVSGRAEVRVSLATIGQPPSLIRERRLIRIVRDRA
jgi:hypothetical protein